MKRKCVVLSHLIVCATLLILIFSCTQIHSGISNINRKSKNNVIESKSNTENKNFNFGTAPKEKEDLTELKTPKSEKPLKDKQSEKDPNIPSDKEKAIFPPEVLKRLAACSKKIKESKDEFPDNIMKHLIDQNCIAIFTQTSQECFNHIPKDWLYKGFDNDFDVWVNNDDTTRTLFSELMKTSKNRIPQELLELHGIKIFKIKSIPQEYDENAKDYPLCFTITMTTDLNNWANGKPSVMGKIFKDKLTKFYNFQSTEGYGKTKWGMDQKQVKMIYPDLKQENESYFTIGLIGDKKFERHFYFVKNKLIEVRIFFTEKYVSFSTENYVDDYKEIQKLLYNKYGEPLNDPFSKENFKDTNLVDFIYLQAGGIGRAIRSGKMSLVSIWEIYKARIEHSLVYKNDKIVHFIHYRSDELIQLNPEIKKDKATLEDL